MQTKKKPLQIFQFSIHLFFFFFSYLYWCCKTVDFIGFERQLNTPIWQGDYSTDFSANLPTTTYQRNSFFLPTLSGGSRIFCGCKNKFHFFFFLHACIFPLQTSLCASNKLHSLWYPSPLDLSPVHILALLDYWIIPIRSG